MELTPSQAADEATLLAHYDIYMGELTAVGARYERDASGVWQPDYLPYWLDPGDDHHVLVFRDAGQSVGFAFVLNAASAFIGPSLEYCLSEFFIAPEHRRRGLGRAAARAIFNRHPGRWELAQTPGNERAIRFWRRVIGEYTGGAFDERRSPHELVQRFDNRAIRGS